MSQSPEPVTAQPATPRKRWPVYAGIAAAAAIAIAVGLFFVLKGGGGEGGVSSGTPSFSFDLVGTKGIPLANHADKGALGSVADKSAADIHEVLDRMYSLAFLDPANWKAGTYDNVFGFFDLGAAQKRAQADVDTLTLGPAAGRKFRDVQPSSGTLSVQVLVDDAGHPVSASASVVFRAKATGAGGSGEIVVSKGQYFMHILEGGWTVFGYSVAREDQPLSGNAASGGSA